MPRFDNNGYNPNGQQNDNRDRTVPTDERYYNIQPPRQSYQNNQNAVNINDYINSFNQQSQGQAYNVQPPQPPAPRNQKQKKKGKKAKRGILAFFSIIIAIIVAVAILATSMVKGVLGEIQYNDKRENEYIDSADLMHDDDIKNILLLGVDARANEEGESSRSDSMMLVSIDAKHECIKMVSFLRDSWVYIPSQDSSQRLNAACTYDGYNGVVDTIEYNFGVDIDGYVVTDFEMFKVLVDSIGGVDIEVTEEEAKEVTSHKRRYGNVTLEAGKHKLTGEQALAYCRIRKIDNDFMRTFRQRTVMQSILKKAKKSKPKDLYNMVKSSAKYIETDLEQKEIIDIGLMAIKCLENDMVETRVPFDTTWDYANINGNSVISVDTEKNKEMLIEYLYKKNAKQIKAEEAEKEKAKNN